MADKAGSGGASADKSGADNHSKGKKSKMQKFSTIRQTCQEAVAFCGDVVSTDSGRNLRKRKAPPPEKKPKMSKMNTMKNTAKEGKAFLNRGKKGRKGKETAAAGSAAAAPEKKD